MEAVQYSHHLAQLFKRALRRLEHIEGKELSDFDWQDVNHRDILARELYHDGKISVEECAPLMRDLVQPSPGGLLAVAYLSRLGQVGGDALKGFACGLVDGEPVPDALDAKDAVEVFDSFTQGMQLTKNARMLIAVYLLSSIYFSAAGRLEALERVAVLPCFPMDERRIIFPWAFGLEKDKEISTEVRVPEAPVALGRAAASYMVDVGFSAADVIRHITTYANDWADNRYVLNGALDLVERNGNELQQAIRRQAFEVCLQHPDASLRRRMYRLAARTESREFLQQAIKDPDSNVRHWALGMLKGN